MYRAMILLGLIAVGFASTVPNVKRYPRQQEHTKTQTQQIVTPTSGAPLVPVQNKNVPALEVAVPVQNNNLPTQVTTVPWEKINSFFSILKPYIYKAMSYGTQVSNYLLQIFGAIFISTTLFGLVCSHTSACSLLGVNQVTEFARTFASPEHVNDVTSIISTALEKYKSQ